MWENERKKTIIRNVLVFIVLVAVVAALGYSYLLVKEQINAEDAQLSAANKNQRQELNEAREESLEAIQKAYEVDLDTVAKYMPGIVCWGDSLTAGSSGNVAYPYTLQKYIDAHICDIYDFRSSLTNPEDYAKVKGNDYKVSIPVVNMGAGQENAATILGRAGVAPYIIKSDFVIPAGKENVEVTFSSPDGKTVTPLTAGSVGINLATIAGVQGTLTMVPSVNGSTQNEYLFMREEEGEAVPVKAGTEIITSAADQYTDYIHIVWLGSYDTHWNASQIISDVTKLLSRQTNNPDRFLVIGPCTYGGGWRLESTFTLDAIDSAMMQAFGNRYINVRKYLIEDGLRDAGISPTKDDTTNLTRGFVPSSFQSNAAGADLNGVAYKLIGKLVYERMDRLGYFDEIRDELNLNKTTQDLLKNDPAYFEKQLKNS